MIIIFIIQSIDQIEAYWTRPFEHKHKEFRAIIDGSNFHNVELFALQREENMKAVTLMFPFLQAEFSVRSGSYEILKEGHYVMVWDSDKNERICLVKKTHPNKVEMTLFKLDYSYHSAIPGAFDINSLKEDRIVILGYPKVKKLFVVTNGYINPFGCLNFTKFKIPKFGSQ